MPLNRRALISSALLAAGSASTFAKPDAVPLEQQLETLGRLGLKLNDGITIDDLLYSFSREEYERRSYSLLLFALGIDVEREPWGRPICSRAWNFDLESIGGTGDYVRFVRRCCDVAGLPRDHFSGLSDLVDRETGDAWLKYVRPDGEHRQWKAKILGRWADPKLVAGVLTDLQTSDRFFYFKDNGQAMVLFFLTPATAAEINRLSGGALKRAV